MTPTIQFYFNKLTFFQGKPVRNSVPRVPMEKDEMRKYIDQLISDSEPWRAIKMVVLGNGRIGKTTLLRYIDKIIDNKVFCVNLH